MKEKLKIMIAEDEAIILLNLRMILESHGYEVVAEAMNGEEACQKAITLKPDLLLIDINLPKMNGLDVIGYINQKVRIPSIIITGYRDEEFVERASKMGVYAYLHKPVTQEELLAAIQISVNRFREYQASVRTEIEAIRKLEDRKIVEKAKGILMDQLGLKEADAMKALQKRSKESNKKLVVVAQEIIHKMRILNE